MIQSGSLVVRIEGTYEAWMGESTFFWTVSTHSSLSVSMLERLRLLPISSDWRYIRHILLRTNNVMKSIHILYWFLLKTSSLFIHLRQLFTKTHFDYHSLPLHTKCFFCICQGLYAGRANFTIFQSIIFSLDSLPKMLSSACRGCLA